MRSQSLWLGACLLLATVILGQDEFEETQLGEECKNRNLDLMILLDSSENKAEFNALKDFATSMLTFAPIDSGNVRVGFVSYSSQVNNRFSFSEHSTSEEVRRAISNADYRPGERNLYQGLQTASVLSREQYGDRANAPNVVLILTTGVSAINQEEAVRKARAMRDAGVSIFTVGVGFRDSSEVDRVNSVPIDDTKFIMDNYGDLPYIADVVFSQICSRISNEGAAKLRSSTELDLVFLLHFSNKISPVDLQALKSFITNIVQDADINSGAVRVGAANYRRDANVIFNLNQYVNKNDLINSIGKIPMSYGSRQANPASGLDTVRTQMFTRATGDRPDVPNAVIVITDSTANENVEGTIASAKALREDGVVVYSIGVNLDHPEEIDVIASTDSGYDLTNFDELEAAKMDIVSQIASLRSASSIEIDEKPQEVYKLDMAIIFHLSKKIKNVQIKQSFLPFLSNLIGKADIDSGNTRISLVNCGEKPKVLFYLNTYNNKKDIQTVIRQLHPKKLKSKKCKADLALGVVETEIFMQNRGDRREVENVILFITDDNTKNQKHFLKAAEAIKNSGVKMFTLGVGHGVAKELKTAATEDYTFILKTYKDFIETGIVDIVAAHFPALKADVEKRAEKQIAVQEPIAALDSSLLQSRIKVQEKADVAIVFQLSHRMTNKEFRKEFIPFLLNLFEESDIDSGNIRVSLINYAKSATILFDLKTYSSIFKLSKVLSELNPRKLKSNKANADNALNLIMSEVFIDSHGDRPDVPNVVILVTDTKTANPVQFQQAASRMKSMGTRLLTIGTMTSDQTELETAATNGLVLKLNRYKDFSSPGFSKVVRRQLTASLSYSNEASNLLPPGLPENAPADEQANRARDQLDLVIYLHLSKKIKNKDIRKKLIPFLIDLVADVDYTKYNIALVYGKNGEKTYLLRSPMTKQDIASHISTLRPVKLTSKNSDLGKALVKIRTMFSSVRDNSSVPAKGVIIISNMEAAKNQQVSIQTAALLRQDGVQIFSIGSNTADIEYLQEMTTAGSFKTIDSYDELASSDIISNLRRTFTALSVKKDIPITVPSSPSVIQYANALREGVSEARSSNSLAISLKADIAIVFQLSKRIRNAYFRKGFVPFITDLLSKADINSGNTKVALVNYGSDAKVEFYLNTHNSFQAIERALGKLNPKKIKNNKANAGRAMEILQRDVFTAARGDRPDAPNGVILITDSKTNVEQQKFLQMATNLKTAGVEIFTIGVDKADANELRAVGTPGYYANVGGYRDIRNAQVASAVRGKFLSLSPPALEVVTKAILPPVLPVTRTSAFPSEGNRKADVAIVFQLSKKVKNVEYRNQFYPFLAQLVDKADIDNGNVRVAVVNYGAKGSLQFPLTKYSKKKALVGAFNKLSPRLKNKKANAASGLAVVRNQVFTARSGDRPDAPNYVVLVTDSKTNVDAPKFRQEAQLLKDAGAKIFTIGSGRADANELQSVASPGHYLKVGRLADLRTPASMGSIRSKIPALDREAAKFAASQTADVVFAVHISQKSSDDDYKRMIRYVQGLIRGADVDSGRIRFGFTIGQSYTPFQLKTYPTSNDIAEALDRLGRNVARSRGFDLPRVLQNVRNNMFTTANGDRPDAPNALVIITDESSNQDRNRIRDEANQTKGKQISIYTVGVGLRDKSQLENVASSTNTIFTVTDYNDLNRAGSILASNIKAFQGGKSVPEGTSTPISFVTLPPPTEKTPAPTPPPTTPRPTAYSPTGYDIVIMLDTSVSQRQFGWMRNWATNIINEMDIDGGEYRVGSMTFSSSPTVKYDLNRYYFSDEAVVPYERYSTTRGTPDIARAFDTVRQRMFTAGSGDRPRARNFIIMITGNERSRNTPQAVAAAKRLEQQGTGIYTIGLNLRDTDEIDGISTKPLYEYRYVVNNEPGLMETPGVILYNMRNAGPVPPPTIAPITTPRPTTTRRTTTRRPTTTRRTTTRRTTTRRTTTRRTTTTQRPTAYSPTGYDIVLMLDSTVNDEQFGWMKTYARNFINQIDIDSGEYRIATMTFGSSPKVEYYLDKYYHADEAVVPIDRYRTTRGTPDFARAFNTVRERMFTRNRGDRPLARNFVVIITGNERSRNTPQSISAAKRLEHTRTGIYTIGLNLGDTAEIDAISTLPLDEYRFLVNNEPGMMETGGVVIYNMQRAAEITPPPPTTRRPVTRRPVTRRPTLEPITYDWTNTECKTTADILFIIDTSGSVGQDNFGKLINFTIAAAAQLDIDLGLHRVGMMTFSDDAHVEFQLNQYQRKSELISAIRRVNYNYGYTHTAEAFRVARTQMLTPRNGDRADSPNMIVIVTDGESNINQFETIPEARYLKRGGNSIITVAVGFSEEYINSNTHSSNELRAMTSPPIEDNLMFVDNYDSLVHLKDKLVHPICTDPDLCQTHPCQNGGICFDGLRSYTCVCQPDFFGHDCEKSCGQPADVVFVLDSSTTVGSANFARIKMYAEQLVRTMNIENCNIRVGVIKYSSAPMLQFGLGELGTDTEAVARGINRVSYTRGRANMAGALHSLRTRMFNGHNGDRRNVRNVAYILTDGSADINRDTTMAEAELAIQSGIRIIPIGVELRDREEVENIATSQGITLTEMNDGESISDKSDYLMSSLHDKPSTANRCAGDPCLNGGRCFDEGLTYRCECSTGFSGSDCEQECSGKADVIFVVESSRYSTRKEFRKIKRFIRNIVIKMTFRTDSYRVGIVEYGSSSRVVLNLSDGDKKRRVQTSVAGLRLVGGEPDPANALKKVLYRMIDSPGDRKGVANYIVFITRSTRNYYEISKTANKLKVSGARIISVGIDTTSSQNEHLKTLSSYPTESTLFLARDASDLEDISGQFSTFVCSSTGQSLDVCLNNPCLNGGQCEASASSYVCSCNQRYAGKNCERPCNSRADIVFLIDSSGSVGTYSFRLIKDYIHHLVDDMNIGPDSTRVGIATFSHFSRTEFYLDQYMDKKRLQSAISGIQYEYGNTNTAAGIKLARTQLFSRKRGDRDSVPNFLFILTDGLSNVKAENTIPEATRAKEQNIHIFSIGVGVTDRWEVDAMASEPTNQNSFMVDNFANLWNISGDLINYVCRDDSVCSDNPCQNDGRCIAGVGVYKCECQDGYLGKNCELDCRARKDIAFVVDTSTSVGPGNFKVMVDYIANLVKALTAGGQDHRFSLIIYSTEVRLIFSFGRYHRTDQIINAIYTTAYMPGATNTAGGLRVAGEIFGSGYGDRYGANNVAILITDGQSNLNFDDTIPAAEALKDMGVKVITLGIGLKNTDEINAIASSPEDVFPVTSFDTLEDIKRDVVGNSCREFTPTERREPTQEVEYGEEEG